MYGSTSQYIILITYLSTQTIHKLCYLMWILMQVKLRNMKAAPLHVKWKWIHHCGGDSPSEGTKLDLKAYGDDEDTGNYEGPTQMVSTQGYF